jgi:integrase
MRMSFKNPIFKIFKVEDPILGGLCYSLLRIETGERVPFYTEFLNSKKAFGSKANSVEAYANDLNPFLSYISAAAEIFSDSSEGIQSPLVQIISSYPAFLVLGEKSPSILSRKVSKLLGWTPVSPSSQKRYLSTANEFIKTSIQFQSVRQELMDLGLLNTEQPPEILFQELSERRKLKSYERRALLQRSFIAGVVSGGAKLIASSFFNFKMATKGDDKIDENKAFPIESTLELINNASNARDQALWALLVGTGIRISEAFNLLIEDIDPLNEQVKIINPNDRPLEFPIKPGKSGSFDFKGRGTADTFFIEPFRSIFFEALKQYIDHERPITNHQVLFVSLAQNKGAPLYWAENSNTYNKPFKKAAQIAGIIGYTVHSLRHTYAFFLVNYIQTQDGFGLPLAVVQLMMGHASLTSTAKYAKIDKLDARNKLENFNRLVQDRKLNTETPSNVMRRTSEIFTKQT